MASTLSLEAYEILGKHFGREDARIVVQSLDEHIAASMASTWNANREQIFEALRRDFVTRELFEERLGRLRAELLAELRALYEKTEKDKAELLGRLQALYEKTGKDKAELLGRMEALYEKTEKDRAELLGKMETLRLSLDRKFTLYFWALAFLIVFINRDALEFLLRLLGVLR
ncbi:MAG: hypothetical protein ACP5NF_09780 [Thermoanaerobaculum sp.]